MHIAFRLRLGLRVLRLGEWNLNNTSIPVADFKALAPKFNPTGFSAHDIVAPDAIASVMVLETAK